MSLILEKSILKEKVITIPIKYEPKLVVRPEYYQRYEIQKLIGLMMSK